MIDDKELTCQKLYAKYHRAYFLECCGFEKRFQCYYYTNPSFPQKCITMDEP